ncbi:hypothetical protein FGIG_10853 [Fasciola gigantica]|uniref:Uncharacterized protein n=1 Tax=Fasciola gigantica TaxID=46835 RepID=A0A504YBT7_FASGI|nr:hypothetical protein FGIG_10853 [Fasciola gigantica]
MMQHPQLCFTHVDIRLGSHTAQNASHVQVIDSDHSKASRIRLVTDLVHILPYIFCFLFPHPLPGSAPGAVTNLLSSPNDSDEDSLYVSAQEYALRRDFEPVENQTRGPGKAIRYEILPRTQRSSITGTHEPTVSLFAAQWPKVSWPSDAWLLLAEFFIAGLETAFSGFVHGFTVRYLIWSPSLGFLANSLFWFGELVGRLPCLFLVRFKPVKKPPPRIASSPIQHRARERTDPRGSAPMSLSPSSTRGSEVVDFNLGSRFVLGSLAR